jgi:hypothetical protein
LPNAVENNLPVTRNTRGTLTAERRQIYLTTLAQTGSHASAVKAAGGHRSSWLDLRKRNGGSFEELCQEAMETFDASLTNEAVRRAVEGIETKVIQRGKVTTELIDGPNGKKIRVPVLLRKYSDAVLIALLRSRKHKDFDFNPATRQEISVNHNGGPNDGRIYLTRDDLRALNDKPELRLKLAEALEAIDAARAANLRAIDAEFVDVTPSEPTQEEIQALIGPIEGAENV